MNKTFLRVTGREGRMLCNLHLMRDELRAIGKHSSNLRGRGMAASHNYPDYPKGKHVPYAAWEQCKPARAESDSNNALQPLVMDSHPGQEFLEEKDWFGIECEYEPLDKSAYGEAGKPGGWMDITN